MRAFLSALLMAAALMPLGLRPASAQVGEVLDELMAQCRRDAAELCRDIEPGGGRVAACLYSRLNDLSPPCHRAMRDGIALRSCNSDYKRFCRDVEIGQGQVAKCLREFRDEVSPRCAQALAFSRPRYGQWDGPRNDPPRYKGPRYDEQLRDDYSDPKYSDPKSPPYGDKYDAPDDDDDRGPDDLK